MEISPFSPYSHSRPALSLADAPQEHNALHIYNSAEGMKDIKMLLKEGALLSAVPVTNNSSWLHCEILSANVLVVCKYPTNATGLTVVTHLNLKEFIFQLVTQAEFHFYLLSKLMKNFQTVSKNVSFEETPSHLLPQLAEFFSQSSQYLLLRPNFLSNISCTRVLLLPFYKRYQSQEGLS